MKADDLVDNRSGRALISTEGKKKEQQAIVSEKVLCLAKDCKELIQPYLPLCKLCFLQSMAGKIEILVLRDNLGNAVFNPTTKKLDFPSTVPKTRFPKKNMKKGKALMGFVASATDPPSPVFVPVLATTLPLQDSGAIGTSGRYGPQRNLSEAIYVDSSYGDLAHGVHATFSHVPTNQEVPNGKDLSLSDPNGIPVLFTSLDNASSANHDFSSFMSIPGPASVSVPTILLLST
jgi:hypothetical protein